MTDAAPWSAQRLFEDERSRIELYTQGGRTLAIAFEPLLYLCPKPVFGLGFLHQQEVDVVAVRRKDEHFYQALSRETFEQVVRPLLGSYERVVGYGSSLGAYAALYFCRDLDAEVIAPSPRVSVHPVYGTPAWQATCEFRHQRFDPAQPARCCATVFYDPREPLDRRYIESEVLPQFARSRVVRVPFAGHPATQFLADIGYMGPFVRAVLAGQTPPALERRRRTRSAAYFQVLADLCARRGRIAPAERLIERSLTLRPNNLLGVRTLGLVKTVKGDWAAAVEALERALAFDPNDRLTQSMLERARRGVEESRPAGWRRWLPGISR